MTFLYHRSIVSNQNKWRDALFRGKIWKSGQSYPHKLLEAHSSNVQAPNQIFIICFYPDLELAEKFEKRDFPISQTFLLRVDEAELVNARFNKTWDDGFNQGEVLLFWREDLPFPSNPDRSNSGIPIDRVEIFVGGAWKSIHESRLAAMPKSPNLTVKPLQVKTKTAKHWWSKFFP